MLLLFDIDGTLMHGHGAREHSLALVRALAAEYGVELADDAVWRVGPWGKTDRRIAREVLRAAGLADRAIDSGSEGWPDRACELYARADLADLPGAVAPGVAAALDWADESGHACGLVTGNLEPIARRKLAAAGLDRLADAAGGFGSDAEERAALVPLARARAGGFPASETIVIGDAPGDVACALADGVRCVAVTTHFAPSALEGAAAVIDTLADLPAAVAGLSRRTLGVPPVRGR